jgi:hypothetical protein
MLEADQWERVLANVTGTMVRGAERVSCHRLLDLLNVAADPAVRQQVAKRLVSPMRRLGWHGPRGMRIPGEAGHVAGCSGYWRSPSRSRQPAVPVEGDVELLNDDLPTALEQVTRLGLKKLARVLRVPVDLTDGNLLRAQVTAAGVAINAQLRADEARLKAKASGDVLERLLAAIEKEKRRQAERKLEADGGGGKIAPALGEPDGDDGSAA